ncbi:putative spermidine/putrescine transport system permease protein [Actinomadura pelletieri DSM 43383]|uniref:Putative spermidine/putrescine transport system permease protein n=1 Tax=Actinomadura pelletieri DSM 43383 TaxID=1120940 RepID=A0A495QA42_9ACTN|nr:ABC transporter permease [Actinomadura pelletieri]RKS68369.1 putative spermidine/putrescine transport system permease protein [Actinomadura pelletieri DSM 43383]
MTTDTLTSSVPAETERRSVPDTAGRRVLTHGVRAVDLVVRAVAVLFLGVPIVCVVVLSFSNAEVLQFPPEEWGLRQYRSFFGSDTWIDAMVLSFKLATVSAAISLLIGIPAVFALYRSRLPLKGLFQAIGLSPLVIPGVAYAVALYTLFVQFRLTSNMVALVFTYAVHGLPFVLLILGSAMARLPAETELVAMTLGASRPRAMVGITLRLLLPAIGASYIFAFITSFDEAVLINFLGGPGTVTLPKAIFDNVKTGLDPNITAIATLLMAGTGVVGSLAFMLRRKV